MAALILFGGGGDLAMRMLLPSLYFLEHDGLLPDGLKIIGAARSDTARWVVQDGSLSSGLSRIGVGPRASMLSRASASRRAVRSSLIRIRSASSPEARS